MTTLRLPYPISSGIYRIVDTASNRFYVGSAVNFGKRWRYHEYRLERGTHPNPILQAIWNADSSRLRFEVVHVLPNPDRTALLAAEQRELDEARVGTNRACMNVLQIAGSHMGRKRSESTRLALSLAQRGKVASDEAKAKMRAAKLRDPSLIEKMRALGKLTLGRKIIRKKGEVRKTLRHFTDEQIRLMRAMKGSGKSYSDIEEHFPVSHGGLQKIIQRKTYTDVV